MGVGIRRAIAVFNQEDLELIGHYPTVKSAAREVFGDGVRSSAISKYLNGVYKTLDEKVWVDVDLSRGIAAVDVDALRERARKRRDEPLVDNTFDSRDWSKFKIEKGIPVPRKRGGRGRFPLSKLDVGDSFDAGEYNAKLYKQVREAIRTRGRYNVEAKDHKFVTRKVEDRLRVWRIK